MTKRYEPVDLSKLSTYSIRDRSHKFDVEAMAGLPAKGATFSDWFEALPPYLGVNELRKLIDAIVAARRADRPVVFAMGAHLVKVGCSTILCDLIERGIVTAVAMNGATAIHDVEVATLGQTSEEVGDTIRDGSFGMVQETPSFFAEAIARGVADKVGLGEAIANHLQATNPPNIDKCLIATAGRKGIPICVHVAMGTDTIHMHANVADSDLQRLSSTDFKLVCAVVKDLAPASAGAASGVWVNVGSSVIMPEVFLKAIAVARNLGANLDDVTTANLDMIRHYRPSQNVVGRPVKSGRGHHITGHHEIMLPLLRMALVERLG
ncbi:MAG TPA: hypothetical protein P5081_11590 [Phycisphaerae bacterium]|nr:hypothetical protein [Phycisphaerae bacterium]HRW53523.1 hypothetical protein [Phycisphaerae bacterium]